MIETSSEVNIMITKNDKRTEVKILTSIAGGFFPISSCGRKQDYSGAADLLDGRDLIQYEEVIRNTVDKENRPEFEGGSTCDLMDGCFDGSRSIQEKVEHAVVSVENIQGVLYGCTTLQIKEPLEEWELHELCDFIARQYSEGWGEGLSQRDIKVDGGILNVYFEHMGDLKVQIHRAEEKKANFENQRKTISNNGKPMISIKLASHPQGEKSCQRFQLINQNRDVFLVLFDVSRLYTKEIPQTETIEMSEKAAGTGSCYEPLQSADEYIENESRRTIQKKKMGKQNHGKEACR